MVQRGPELVRAGHRALLLNALVALAAAGLAVYVADRPGSTDVSGQMLALAAGLLAAVWAMDGTRVRWGSDRAGQVQTATAANTVLFPAAILLPPMLFLAVGLASSAAYIKRSSHGPYWLGNACIRVAEMSIAAVTFSLLAGDPSLDPSDLRSVVALTAAAIVMLVTEAILVVHLTRAWDGLDFRDLPLWAWADLLPEVPEVLVGALFCLLYPTPATVLVLGLIVWSHHTILQHARLRAASRDDKTGLLSLPAFETLATAELDRAGRTGHPLAVLLMDLDGLKKVNTEHGHLAGDQYIAAMARLLADTSRSYDLVARFGGDEFCLLLPDTPLSDASAFAERIRASAGTTPIPGVATPMAVSIGVAAAEPTDDVRTLLATADTALRHAKSHGRNQVKVAPTHRRPAGDDRDVAHSAFERNA